MAASSAGCRREFFEAVEPTVGAEEETPVGDRGARHQHVVFGEEVRMQQPEGRARLHHERLAVFVGTEHEAVGGPR
jgi:hypothetical protein